MSRRREIGQIVRHLRSQGFDVDLVRSGHWRVTAPDGRRAQIAATPGSNRAVLNCITRLKRIGYVP